MVYVVSNFQNPTGIVWSDVEKKEAYSISRRI